MTRPGFSVFFMRRTGEKADGANAVQTDESMPEFRPWREVGWIFRDGDCIAIERQGDEIRARTWAD